jgi:hypothetical protein
MRRGEAETMQRVMLAAILALAILALAILAWPVQAQTPTDQGTVERVVLDALLLVIPPFQEAPCMRLEAGQLTARLRNTSGEAGRPTTFRLQGYRGEDPGVHIETIAAGTDSTTVTTLAGGLYCWSFEVYAPVSMTDSMSVRTNYSQGIALKLTLAPQ